MDRLTVIPLNDDQRATILAVDPEFFSDDREIKMREANQRCVDEYCAFCRRNRRRPRILIEERELNIQDKEEHRLVNWRINMNKAANGLGTSLPLNDDQRATILDFDPEFFLTDREIQLRKANQKVIDYCDFYRLNQRQPRIDSQDYEECLLGQWRFNMKKAVNCLDTSLLLNADQRATEEYEEIE